jgi:hypothetical protein
VEVRRLDLGEGDRKILRRDHRVEQLADDAVQAREGGTRFEVVVLRQIAQRDAF